MEDDAPLSNNPNNPRGRSCLYLVLSLVILLVCIAVGGASAYFRSYNQIVQAKNTIDQHVSQVDVVLQRRYDLIPNLVATVRGSAEHESSVLTEVTRLRGQFNKAEDSVQRELIAGQLDSALDQLIVSVEAYPNLRANENFAVLQSQLEATENRIAVERQRQNLAIRDYNTLIASYPGKAVATISGFEPYRVYFRSEPKTRKAPKVTF